VIGDFLLLLVIVITYTTWWIVVSVVKPARSLCGASEKSFVEGSVLAPWEPRRATLVEHVIELPSLLG